MASAAANSALGTEVLAVQRLYLQHHAKWSRVHLPPLLKPASWLRYRGLDEACVYQLSLMDVYI
jgi:hypothetical protein